MSQPSNEAPRERLHRAIWDYMKSTPQVQRQLLEEYPELLSDEALTMLDILLTEALRRNDEMAQHVFSSHKKQLQSHREQETTQDGSEGPSELQRHFEDSDRAAARGDRAAQAIALRKAIAAFTPDDPPRARFGAHYLLGRALLGDLAGECPAGAIDLAIHHFQLALELITKSDFPEDWAEAHNFLGIAYRNRQSGNIAENIDRALEHYQLALQVYTRDAFPTDWADLQNNLASAYRHRPSGNIAENLDAALYYYHQALQVHTQAQAPTKCASITRHMGHVWLERIEGDHADNIETAIGLFEAASKMFAEVARDSDGNDSEIHFVHSDLAKAYRARVFGDMIENIERSIDCAEMALKHCDKAISSHNWANAHNELGLSYRRRALGDFDDNRRRSIEHYTRALEIWERRTHPREWGMVHMNIASTYSTWVLDDRAEAHLELAIRHGELGIQMSDRLDDPTSWATDRYNLGRDYHRRIKGDRVANVRRAVEYYRLALEVFTSFSSNLLHRKIQRNLGDAYLELRDWVAAHHAYSAAIDAGSTRLDGTFTFTGRRAEIEESGLLHSRDAYCLVQAGLLMEGLIRLEAGKTRYLSEALRLEQVTNSTVAEPMRSKLARARERVRSLESEHRRNESNQSTSHGIASNLNVAREELDALVSALGSTFDVVLSFDDIVEIIPPDGALVAPVVTSQGTVVFVLPFGTQSVTSQNVVGVEGFRMEALGAFLEENFRRSEVASWGKAYRARTTDPKAWHATIVSVTRTLWDSLLAPICDRLSALGVRAGASLLMLPQGGLRILPLHAAWRPVNGQPRSLLDDYTIHYAASAYVMHANLKSALVKPARTGPALVVTNPTQDLAFAEIEGALIRNLFAREGALELKGIDAVPERVMHEATRHAYIHFCCHGMYNDAVVTQSGLLLADHSALTLEQVIEGVKLDQSRLVTLSACESGITAGGRASEEHFGLAAGFMQAGAPAVLASLWEVNDLSTALLMERFYASHLKGASFPEALRHAQLWLRDATAGEVVECFEGWLHADQDSLSPSSETLVANLDILRGMAVTHQPFAHPYYWAGFALNGA
jgi:CHAT domain-containing protein/tetratricopeptide (TPR) repeat protein